MTTVFKKIKVNTKSYRKVMKQIGKCIESGGYVEYDHHKTTNRDINGHLMVFDFIDATLYWK